MAPAGRDQDGVAGRGAAAELAVREAAGRAVIGREVRQELDVGATAVAVGEANEAAVREHTLEVERGASRRGVDAGGAPDGAHAGRRVDEARGLDPGRAVQG